ncbi:MAG: allantoicase [Pseudomonadota bacterium]
MTADFATTWINLAQPRLGAEMVAASDDFFAAKERLIGPGAPVFIPDKYDAHGKWMDGWESRRKRGPGHDWAILRLGQAGIVHGVEIDTRHFTGNYPAAASLDACADEARLPGSEASWTPLVPATALEGDRQHFLAVDDARAWTHLRLNIYPDGGVARLRVYGRFALSLAPGTRIDLAALEHGGRPIACNDAHFGVPENLLAPGRGVNMGDGWETRRRRAPGYDWAILALGQVGTIDEILIDTLHFKGNYPDRCFLQAALAPNLPDQALIAQAQFWPLLLPEQKLEANREHRFTAEVAALGPVSHVRFNIVPDGGVSRLRLYGTVAPA